MQLVDIYLSDDFTSCENCGHPIKWRYVVAEGRARKTIGSECAVALLGPVAANMDRRAKRAAAQWRKQEPAPLAGEMREQYIGRRLVEMANAQRAHRAYAMHWVRYHSFLSYASKVNARAKRLYRLPYQANECQYDTPFKRSAIEEKMMRKFERRYRANRYDFMQPSWNIIKI